MRVITGLIWTNDTLWLGLWMIEDLIEYGLSDDHQIRFSSIHIINFKALRTPRIHNNIHDFASAEAYPLAIDLKTDDIWLQKIYVIQPHVAKQNYVNVDICQHSINLSKYCTFDYKKVKCLANEFYCCFANLDSVNLSLEEAQWFIYQILLSHVLICQIFNKNWPEINRKCFRMAPPLLLPLTLCCTCRNVMCLQCFSGDSCIDLIETNSITIHCRLAWWSIYLTSESEHYITV